MRNYTLHIIDDDPLVAKMLEKRLGKLEGVSIQGYQTIAESLGNHESPDLIILDHDLGRHDGATGVASIPTIRKFFKESKIVILSGQKNIEVYQKALEYGSSYYFQKSDQGFDELERFVSYNVQHANEKKFTWPKISFGGKKKSKKIVLIDDDYIFNSLFHFKLMKFDRNLILINFSSPEAALKEDYKQMPSVVLLDHSLGDTDGLVWVDQLKDKFKEAKIMVLSSDKNLDTAMKYQAKGITDFLDKSGDYFDKIAAELKKI